VDFEVLHKLLGYAVDEGEEKYDLTWQSSIWVIGFLKAEYPQPAIPVGHHRVNRSKSVKPIIRSEIVLDNRPSSGIFYPCLSWFVWMKHP